MKHLHLQPCQMNTLNIMVLHIYLNHVDKILYFVIVFIELDITDIVGAFIEANDVVPSDATGSW